MDLPIEKLEKFTLEDFINVHRFYLCKRTTSQNQIASYLQFDSDSIAIINHPPDNFSRCEKLYELIQKKSTVVKFLEALEETGNEHIIKFIKETDFSASEQTASTSANPNRRRGIWFNIPEPIDSFCGREDFLTNLHDKLKPCDDSKTKANVLSQIKVVTGLGGIGKTETATKYTREQQNFYNNLIWVDAENENLMTNLFLKLADEIQIPVKNSEGKPREIQDIVGDIYKKNCHGGKSNLIVFDNAEDYESCKNFFQLGLAPELKSMIVILVTSRNQEWISPIGEIEFLLLDKMAESESLEFILKRLDIKDSPEFKEESREFIQLLGGLPLALHQAVAYVKHQKKVKGRLGISYTMNDYVKEFRAKAEKLQNYPYAKGSTTVFVTWNLTLEKIKEDELYGEIAIEIIEAMSFLYADKIPTGFLLQLLPFPPPSPQDGINRWQISIPQDHKDFESDFLEGLNLLEQFSMIKIPQNETTNPFASIHRQVQFVIIHDLKICGRLIQLFGHLGEKCKVVLEKTKVSELSDIFLNAHQIVNNQVDLGTPLTVKFLDFKAEYGGSLFKASRYPESFDLYKKLYKEFAELLGEIHEKTLTAHHNLATLLLELGKYDESLNLFTEILEKQQLHLGVDHPSTIRTKHNMASVLFAQEKYSEALEMSQEVLAQQIKIRGENHPETLSTQHQMSIIYAQLGRSSKALTLYEALEEKQTQLLGPDHRDVLVTKQNKAGALYKMGRFEEALKIFNEVHEKQKEALGENHLSTIETLGWIARTLEELGKVKEALKMYQKVYDIRKVNLGVDHPVTIVAWSKTALLLQKQGENQESLEAFQHVLAQQNKIHGENHSLALDSQSQIAGLHLELGNFSKAFALYQVLEQKLTEILGPDHNNVLRTKHNKACALYKMGRFEEASTIFNEVYNKNKDKLGEYHLDTITTLFMIAGTLENQEKLTEAFEMYKKVYRLRKMILPEDHPETIEVEKKIVRICVLYMCNLWDSRKVA